MDRYDEALAKARAGKTLEEIFPEMKESEDERDERIRKAIVHLLTVASESYLIDATGFKKEQFLSYLEKQKEAELTEEDKKIIPEALVMLCDDIINHRVHTPIKTNEEGARKIKTFLKTINRQPHKSKEEWEKQKEQDKCPEFCVRSHCIGCTIYEKQKEQKLNLTAKGKGVYKICPHCKSRMIRDDSKVYTSMPPQYGYNCPKCGTMEFDTVMYDNPEMDEQIIASAPLYTIEQVDKKIRGAQEWKPSKEQMEALNALNCHGDLSYVGQQNQLISLYNDLKKLI